MGEPVRWDSVAAAVESLKEKRDDIESIKLNVKGGHWTVGQTVLTGAFAELEFCDGRRTLISLDVAEALLNDGILSKLRVPLKLVPTE